MSFCVLLWNTAFHCANIFVFYSPFLLFFSYSQLRQTFHLVLLLALWNVFVCFICNYIPNFSPIDTFFILTRKSVGTLLRLYLLGLIIFNKDFFYFCNDCFYIFMVLLAYCMLSTVPSYEMRAHINLINKYLTTK